MVYPKGRQWGARSQWKLDPENGEPPKHPLQLHGFEEKYRSCGLHRGKGGEPKSHRWRVSYMRNEEVVAPQLGYEISASLHLGACCLCGHSHSSRVGTDSPAPAWRGFPKVDLSLCDAGNTRCHSRRASFFQKKTFPMCSS